MNKQRKTSHILNVFQYDADGHVILPASLTLSIAPTSEDNSGKVPTTAWVRSIVGGTVTAYTPTSRTITINGTSYDLSSNRAWSIDTGVLTASAGSGISVSVVNQNLNIVNTGILTASSGAGISLSVVNQNLNVVNTGILTASAGLGISLSVVGQNLNVVNTGILTASAGSGISLSVVDQNLNVVNTGILTATAGAGISLSVVNGNLNVVNTITNNNQLTNGAGYITSSALTGYATETYVGTAISNLVDAAPGTLDTLNELAAALGDDPNFATTVSTSIGTKVPQTRTISINGTSYDLSSDRSWTINSMVYPSAGIALSTGTAWGTSITDNSANWNTAFGWGNHASAGYLTSATAASTYASLTGSYANPSWITSLAYSKITGVPAFLTSYTETDTLATVTGRGASTSTNVTFNGTLTSAGQTVLAGAFRFYTGGTDGSTAYGDFRTNPATGNSIISAKSNALYFNYDHGTGGVIFCDGATGIVATVNAAGVAVFNGNVTGASFIKSGGTSSQFLKADGSIDSSTYLTGITSSQVTTALGFTPYNATNPNGYITGYTETDTLASVTSRGNTTTGSINVNGNILMTGTATTTNQARTIDFTGFDKEGVTDFSDRAYIQHTTNTGGHTGSVLVIASENDAEDGIAFLTNASSKLKHNSNNIATESFVTSQGYVTGGPYLPLIGGSISGTLTTNGQLAVANNIVMYGDNKQIQWNAAASADLFISAIPGTRTIEIRNGNAASPNYAACGLITGYATFTSNVTVQGNITVSSSNTTGGGIILADDGDIVDLNDAYCSMRFSYGVRIYSANRGGSPVITLANTGVVTATTFSGALSGNATTASSISGFNNPTTAATANTIVYRDGSGDVAAREFVLTASTIHVDTPSSMLGIYPTTNQVVKFGSPAARNFLNVPTRTGGDATGTWAINITGSATDSSTDFLHSNRDFPSGTLVQTSIAYGEFGDPFILEIRGNSYFNQMLIDIQIQGYIYGGTIIATAGLSNGKPISVRAIRVGGNLAFWWPTGGYWEGFNVKVYTAYAGRTVNKVTSITNSAQPTTDKQVDFSLVQSLHSSNYNSYSPTLTGGNASGTWGINITGSAATATDSTKLPLAGGTLTGNLLFSNSGTAKRGIQGVCGDNDFWFIGGGATASNSGFLEIATGDDGQGASAEPIYVSQYGPGDVLTGTLFRRASLLDASGNTSFPGSLSTGGSVSIAGNTALHAGNYTSYTLPRGGGWYGVNLPGSRWGGFAVDGGEISFGNGLPNANQMGILIDGAYLAGENNGFWSLPSDNNWNGRRGMYWDGSQLNFTTNSPVGRFSGLMVDCGAATGRSGSGYAPANLNIILTSSTAGSDGVCGIDFRSGNNYPSDGASIYYENSQTGSGEVSRLVLRVENDYNDSILIRAGYHVYNARTVDMASQGADNPVFRWQYLDSNRMTLDSSGNLVCNGDVTAYSDARIKTNVHTIENALDKTLRMRGVTYNRTDVNDTSNKVGVIAQEVMEILPEVVHEQSDGMLGVSYGNIVGVLIEAIKEQQKQIEELQNKVNSLIQN